LEASGGAARFVRGVCWIGAALGQPGAAVYLDTWPFGRSGAWDFAEEWLHTFLEDGSAAQDAVRRLRPQATLASIGLEGACLRTMRAKLYWRLDRPVRLAELGIGLLKAPELAHFLARAVEQRPMALSGTVFSTGFSLHTGELEDVKLDLCGHCLPREPKAWGELLEGLSTDFGLVPVPVGSDLAERRCELAFLGLGVDRAGDTRLNVYLKETAEPHAEPRLAPRVEQAEADAPLDRAADYLLGLQQPDGSWSDYALPVGAATQWVTAFTGWSLALWSRSAGAPGIRARARAAATRAATWLTEHRAYPAGWGYNERTGVDADSTGLAIRLLRALDLPVSAADEARLLRQWRPTGGFATYDRPDHWGDVHPCVTAVAFPALASERQQELLPALLRYLGRAVRPDGTLPAYWWRSHLYSTYHYLRLMAALAPGRCLPRPPLPSSDLEHLTNLELAYAVGIQHLTEGLRPGAAPLQALLQRQQPDGGWSGGANLRVTDPECARPWDTPQGQLYVDLAGTITTASVLLVLSGAGKEVHP
jgi:hypothetical protein